MFPSSRKEKKALQIVLEDTKNLNRKYNWIFQQIEYIRQPISLL